MRPSWRVFVCVCECDGLTVVYDLVLPCQKVERDQNKEIKIKSVSFGVTSLVMLTMSLDTYFSFFLLGLFSVWLYGVSVVAHRFLICRKLLPLCTKLLFFVLRRAAHGRQWQCILNGYSVARDICGCFSLPLSLAPLLPFCCKTHSYSYVVFWHQRISLHQGAQHSRHSSECGNYEFKNSIMIRVMCFNPLSAFVSSPMLSPCMCVPCSCIKIPFKHFTRTIQFEFVHNLSSTFQHFDNRSIFDFIR